MRRMIIITAALCLLVCLLAIPPQTSAAVDPVKPLLTPGQTATTERVEFVLLSVKMLGNSAVSLQYRLRADSPGKCRIDLESGAGQPAGCDVMYLDLPETGETEGSVLWSEDGSELRRVTVTLPTASSTKQFTYAIG